MPDVALLAEPMAPAALKQFVEGESRAAGFEVARVARIADLGDEAGRRLQDFLSERLHGDMDWLERTADRRQHPHVLWPEARSAILLGLSYAPSRDPLEALAAKDRGVISVYAQGSEIGRAHV